MDPAKPSLELLRALTDEHVLRALMREGRLTRAELATATGISKPTAGESVRRLVAAGLVADTGQRTPGGRGRGRVGSYYSLAEDVGLALAVSIAPEGIIAECISPYGEVISRAEQAVDRPARPEQLAAALGAAATQAVAGLRRGKVPAPSYPPSYPRGPGYPEPRLPRKPRRPEPRLAPTPPAAPADPSNPSSPSDHEQPQRPQRPQ